jgi:endonuclease G
VDENYEAREGYDATFIPRNAIAMPKPGEKMQKHVAPLRAGEPEAAKGILKYQHFSVVMHKTKRLAIVTATNIDGRTYLSVNRDTGRVREAEAEKWFTDPRISDSFIVDQSFYSEWSTYFDRGHLTRRTDVTWGSAEDAERANADTYHFTNCTPQHFRFNQTADYWQGVERYVLENGALAEESRARIVVFQGPIWNNAIDLWADDVQVPSSFWKVVAWKGKTALKAVGLVVDQLDLLTEARKNLGKPRDLPAVDVSEWREPIAQIAKRTGLVFDPAVVAADTIAQQGQPAVGAEVKLRINSWEQLL